MYSFYKFYELMLGYFRCIFYLGDLFIIYNSFYTPSTVIGASLLDVHNQVMGILIFIFLFVVLLLGRCLLLSLNFSNIIYFKGLIKLFFLPSFYANINHFKVFNQCPFLEFIWTLLPTLILIIILYPSLSVLYVLDDIVDPGLTVFIFGCQWFWSYELDLEVALVDLDIYNIYSFSNENIMKVGLFDFFLVNNSNEVLSLIIFFFNNFKEIILNNNIYSTRFDFDSRIILCTELTYLLEVDRRLVLPVGMPVRLVISSKDVLHSWSVPSLGIKVDACPGRFTEVIFIPEILGVYRGQCSEFCGNYHSFMPIVLDVRPIDDFVYFFLKCH